MEPLDTAQPGGRGPQLTAVDIQDLGITPKDTNFTFHKRQHPGRSRPRPPARESGPYALVVSDAAPNTTGNRLVDQGRSEELVESVMGLALEVLSARRLPRHENIPGRGGKAPHHRSKDTFRSGARLQARGLPGHIIRDLSRGDGIQGLMKLNRAGFSGTRAVLSWKAVWL